MIVSSMSVFCSFNDGNNESVLIGCIYKSPNSTIENTIEMYKLLKSMTIKRFMKVCIVGDFNYPNIKWKGEWSGAMDN